MKRYFELGRINLFGTGKRYPVTVGVELKARGNDETFFVDPVTKERRYTGEVTPSYVEFTASAMVGARMGGQCLDEINEHRMDFKRDKRELWDEIFRYWKLYHLNGMHAGTPEQEKAIEDWKAEGNKYDYTAVCNMLKENGLYEIPFTGKTVGKFFNGELYRYGNGWVVSDIPGDDLIKIEHLLSAK